MSELKLHSKVVQTKSIKANHSYAIGEIIAILDDGDVIVEWYGKRLGYVERVALSALCSEDMAKVLEAIENDKQNKLDAEFEDIREKLQGKLDQAAALVQEAADMAKAVKKDFSSLRNECRPLFNTLNQAGWSPSSMKC